MFRTAITGARRIHSTPVAFKTLAEKVSEVADKVNKKVGQGFASAIETGEKATESTKQSLGNTVESAKKSAEDVSRVAGQKSNQAAAGAREAKEDFKKEVKK